MAGGTIFNTWQFAFQYGGLKQAHNKNKTKLKTGIILGRLEGRGRVPWSRRALRPEGRAGKRLLAR